MSQEQGLARRFAKRLPNRKRADASGGIGVRRWSFAPAAWFAVLGGIAAILFGRHFGWIELIIAGCFGVIGFFCAGLVTIGRSNYSVDLALGETKVSVGERAFGRIAVENVGKRGLRASLIELPVGNSRAIFQLPALAPRSTFEELFAVPTKKRAVIAVGPVKSVRTDPLGFIRREITWTPAELLYVHPQTVSLHGAAAGVMRDLEGQTLRTVTDTDMNFHALREYVPGDDMRSIHWRSSARNQSLLVRQFEDTRRTHTALAIEVNPTPWRDEESFELGVSVFASIGVNTIHSEMDRSFFVDDAALRSHSPLVFLNATSSIQMLSTAPDVEAVERIGRDAPDCSLAVVVTGGNADLAALRSAATKLNSAVRLIFIQCDSEFETSVRTSSQISFARIGDLSQLPKLMRLAVIQ